MKSALIRSLTEPCEGISPRNRFLLPSPPLQQACGVVPWPLFEPLEERVADLAPLLATLRILFRFDGAAIKLGEQFRGWRRHVMLVDTVPELLDQVESLLNGECGEIKARGHESMVWSVTGAGKTLSVPIPIILLTSTR